MTLVKCPCCRGRKALPLYDPDGAFICDVPCCHCEGKGVVEAEVEETDG